MPNFPFTLSTFPDDAGQRLDQYLAAKLPDVSRSRLQQLIAKGEVLVNQTAAKASLRLKGEEEITVTGPPHAPPLRAIPEEIALDIVYEDDDLAIVNKPAGMMVHAGAGATEDARNRGTLVNALLHHFKKLSSVGGARRLGEACERAGGAKDVHCAGPRLPEAGSRHNSKRDQPPLAAAHADDDA